MPTQQSTHYATTCNAAKRSRNDELSLSLPDSHPCIVHNECMHQYAHAPMAKKARCWFIFITGLCGAFQSNTYSTYVVIVCNPYHSKIYCTAHIVVRLLTMELMLLLILLPLPLLLLLSLYMSRKGQRHPFSSSSASSSSSYSWKKLIPKYQMEINQHMQTWKAFGRSTIIAFISPIENKKPERERERETKNVYIFSNKIKLIWFVFCYVLLYSIYLNFDLCFFSLMKRKRTKKITLKMYNNIITLYYHKIMRGYQLENLYRALSLSLSLSVVWIKNLHA